MIEALITMFAQIFFSMFVYLKILNLGKVGLFKIICGVSFSTILAFLIYLLREPMPYTRFVIMILALVIFIWMMTNTRFDLALTTTVISMGISYGFFLVSALIVIPLIVISPLSINTFVLFLSLIIQFMFIFFLFKIKRLKNGIPFLKKRRASAIGLVISGAILVIVALIINDFIDDETLGLSLVIGVALGIAGLILWWRRGLTRLYREKIKESNAREYEAIIAKKDELIQKIQKDNDRMAKIIHRDNKLLPAMYKAVRANVNNNQESVRVLEQLMTERAGLIVQSQREANALPSTKDFLIDGIMNLMSAKAAEKEIQFDLIVKTEIKKLTETLISPLKLETLVADLIENAIIATSHSNFKKILVTIGIIEGFYELNIQDSGIPFEADTLHKLGLERASSHLDDGGSGIGYMTVFEILSEAKASLIITKYESEPRGFSKSVRVRFDNKSEFIVESGGVHELRML